VLVLSVLCAPDGDHENNFQNTIVGSLRSRSLTTLAEISAAVQDMLRSGATSQPSWSMVLWSVLGLVAGCVSIVIVMAVNMHYRLKQSFAAHARSAGIGGFAPSPNALPHIIDPAVTLSVIAIPESISIAALDVAEPAIAHPRSRLQG
jgi:heme/copper-type cytochrome/quinol oxidase subunit 2